MKSQKGVEVWLYLLFNFGTRWRRVFNATPRPLYPRKLFNFCKVSKSHPTGIRSPDRPARSDSLYRLIYPGPPTGIGSPDRPAGSESLYRLSYPCPPTGIRSPDRPARSVVVIPTGLSRPSHRDSMPGPSSR